MTRPLVILMLLAAPLSGCQFWSKLSAEHDDQRPTHSTANRQIAALEHYGEAQKRLREGMTDSALASFMLALEENPMLVEAHVGMADIYRDRGNHQLAANAYQRATTADPNHYDAHYWLGQMRQLLGELKAALRAYLKAIAIRPHSFDANYHVALVYLQLDRPADALPHAVKATKLDKLDQSAWQNLGFICLRLGKNQQAIESFQRAIELGTPPDELVLGLVDVQIRTGQYDDAVTALKAVLEHSPSGTAYERLGYLHFKQRRFDDALAAYRNALKLDARDTAALNGVGACLMTMYLRGGSEDKALLDDALNHWRKSVKIRRNQPRIINLIAKYNRG